MFCQNDNGLTRGPEKESRYIKAQRWKKIFAASEGIRSTSLKDFKSVADYAAFRRWRSTWRISLGIPIPKKGRTKKKPVDGIKKELVDGIKKKFGGPTPEKLETEWVPIEEIMRVVHKGCFSQAGFDPAWAKIALGMAKYEHPEYCSEKGVLTPEDYGKILTGLNVEVARESKLITLIEQYFEEKGNLSKEVYEDFQKSLTYEDGCFLNYEKVVSAEKSISAFRDWFRAKGKEKDFARLMNEGSKNEG